MRAGSLRHRVTLTDRTEVDDGHHGFTAVPVTLASRIPAYVEPLTGRELDRAQMIDPRATHLVTLRYRTDIRARQTVTYHDGMQGDRTFEIVGPPIDPDERHRELQLTCKEATT